MRDTGGTGEGTTNWGQEQEQGDSAQGETKEWSRRGAREWGAQSRAEEGLGFCSVRLASGSPALGHGCHS